MCWMREECEVRRGSIGEFENQVGVVVVGFGVIITRDTSHDDTFDFSFIERDSAGLQQRTNDLVRLDLIDLIRRGTVGVDDVFLRETRRHGDIGTEVVCSDERDETVREGSGKRGVAFFVAVAEEAMKAVLGVSVLCAMCGKEEGELALTCPMLRHILGCRERRPSHPSRR